MKRPSNRFFITAGLTSMLAGVLFVAIFSGVLPDPLDAERRGRAAWVESLAVSVALMADAGDPSRAAALLGFVGERHPAVRSIGLRSADGTLVQAFGDHRAHWQTAADAVQADSQMLVPIRAGDRQWGQLEVSFSPLIGSSFLAELWEPRMKAAWLVLAASFVAFFFYLGRVLKQLDPSAAIPARVRAALDTMTEGLLIIDPREQILLANQAFGHIVGTEPDHLVGQRAAALRWLGEDGAPVAPAAAPWAGVLAGGVTVRGARLQRPRADGGHQAFIVNSSPILAGDKVNGALVSFEDITPLQDKERELRAARNEAVEANRAKSDFLANMSHEIRTPMNAILGFADLLRRGGHRGPDELRRHLETIHSSGRHLLGLIDDILDLSKVESGRIEYERRAVAPGRIVAEVVDVLAVRAAEKGIGLVLVADGLVPASVTTDGGRLRQIVTNVVGNAIKFTDIGEVRVSVRLARRDDATHRLHVTVDDSGIGIPPEAVERIFEPFSQADASTTRRFGGTGLGLTISRRFARDLGGDIVVSSTPGRGSRFDIVVDAGPLDGVALLPADEAFARTGAAASVSRWAFSRGRVLVVDDGDENRELLRLVLGDAGLRVDEARDGAQAIAAVAMGAVDSDAFDVVLMDMQMPVMDGFAATRALRRRGDTVPVIALTAHAMKGFERTIAEAGCSGYLTKPVDIDRLLETLATLLPATREDARDPAEGTAAPAREVSVSAATAAPISGEARDAAARGPVRSRLAGNPRLAPVAARFAAGLAPRIEQMQAAAGNADLAELAVLAHWLKGSAGTTGFDQFTAPAARLERLSCDGAIDAVGPALADIVDLASRIEAPVAAVAEAAG
ncbi:MAG: ATP-binding protein [Lautropia sp.]